jgi:hypothetical protein
VIALEDSMQGQAGGFDSQFIHGGNGVDYQQLIKNYRPRELTELERIYVIFKRNLEVQK